jgi:methylated-DNA-[protein]-cysteine S-methyltransferase
MEAIMNTYVSTIETPAGPFTLVADGDVVLASGWTADLDELLTPPGLEPKRVADLGSLTKAVLAYHDGDLAAINEVEVRQPGGAFLSHAWSTLRGITPGTPATYTELADLAGRPAAVRAAAQACARNAAALFVPCHRVIRRDGTLGGFRWGLDVKQWLLHHERTAVADEGTGH